MKPDDTILSVKNESYTCAKCGGTFVSEWSDEEARAEAEGNFGSDVWEQTMSVICDDCYQAFMAWHHAG